MKGFAVALTIGVIASLFSALIVSRTLYAWAIEKFGLDRIKMMAVVQGTKVNFLGYRKRAISLSLAVIIGSMSEAIMALRAAFAARSSRSSSPLMRRTR